jgi:uncharacterized protein (DUF1697 family)
MRYIAFLRAVNVGGRVVKMDRLRALFETLGFRNVETFIASGNVIFETRSRSPAALEARIERALQETFGFSVATMIRTDAEVAAIARSEPFPRAAMDAARGLHVGFLKAPVGKEERKLLQVHQTADDELHTEGREFYWMCRTLTSQSTFFKLDFEKAYKVRVTFRSMKTVRNLAGRYPPPDPPG